jgi:hypothetical protein
VYRLPFLLHIRQRGYAPVGHLGVEPSYTALSERPLRPDGSWPLRGRWRCRAPRCYPSRGFKPRCGAGRASSMEESDGLEPLRSRAHSPSKRRPRPWRVHSPCWLSRPMRAGARWQRTERTMPTALPPPPGFRPGPTTWPVHPLQAEGAVIETDGRDRASLSGRALPLAGSPSITAP